MPLVLDIPTRPQESRSRFRSILRALAELARSDASPQEFQRQFLTRALEALQGEGGALWIFGSSGQDLAYQINFRASGLIEGNKIRELGEHNRLIQSVVNLENGLAVPPSTPSVSPDSPGNPCDFWILACRLRMDRETWGVVEVLQRPGAMVGSRDACLQFLAHTCQVAEEFYRKRELRQFFDREALWSKLENFARRAHASLDLGTTAQILAQEARSLIDCDRVAIASWRGRSCRLEAMSAVDSLERRAPATRLLEQLTTLAARSREPLWYDGDTSNVPPQVERILVEYADESDVRELALVPLVHAPDDHDSDAARLVGVLVVEQFQGSCRQPGMTQRMDVVSGHAAVALAHALECRGWPLAVARMVRRSSWYRRWMTLPRAITAVLVLMVLGCLAAVPIRFDVVTRGVLRPSTRNVFAETDGTVTEILVRHGQEVRPGQELLRLANHELQRTVDGVQGRLEVVRENLATYRSQRALAQRRGTELTELVMRIGELQLEEQAMLGQLAILQRQQDSLTVRAPRGGEVVTWDLEGRLAGRPVRTGDLLLEIAAPGEPWQLEVYLPESSLGSLGGGIGAAPLELPVSYVLADQPGEARRGTLREVERAADLRAGQNVVRVLVDVDANDMPPRPRLGLTATARIHCGQRPLVYVLFKEVLDFARRAWFRLRP